MPPTPSFDDLANYGVVVAPANIELKVIAALLRLDVLVALVQHLVKLLHQPQVDREKKIRLFEFWPVQLHSVTFGHRNVKVLQQVDDRCLFEFQFLLEQTHDQLIHLVDCLVDCALAQVPEVAQFKRLQLTSSILLVSRLRHPVVVPVVEIVFRRLLGCLFLYWLRLCLDNIILPLHFNRFVNRGLDWLRRLQHQSELNGSLVLNLLAFNDWREAWLVHVAVHKN